MITIDKSLLSPDLIQRLDNLNSEISKFRQEGELDQLSKEKLRDYFRTQHIFHSAGSEGNRLTLQETMLVLKEGVTISEKSIQDTIEVKNLGIAFDFFYELAQQDTPISENYIKHLLLSPLGFVLSIILFILFVGAMFSRFLIKASPGEALVKTGFGLKDPLISTSSAFVIPLLHKIENIDMTVKTIRISRRQHDSLSCADGSSLSYGEKIFILEYVSERNHYLVEKYIG